MQERIRALPKIAWVVAVAVVATVLAVAMRFGGGESIAEEAVEAPVVPVIVRAVEFEDRAVTFAVSGEVEARRTVNLGFKIPGVVARVLVEEGQSVQAGQPLAELDDVEYRLNMELAETQVDLARDAHTRASEMFENAGLPEADFVRAEVALRQASLQFDLARNQVEDTRLVASTSGVIARRSINEGEQAGPGVPVFTVVVIDPAQVRVGVPEAEIAQVRVGQQATVRLPSQPGVLLEGRVEMVGVVADPVSRTYAVKIGVPNREGRLRSGMIAEATIRHDSDFRIITIPGEAVVPDADGATRVFVYDPEDQRVHARRIRVGTVYGQEVEVVTGLEHGDQVVVGGQHRVRSGSRVEAAADVTGAATGHR